MNKELFILLLALLVGFRIVSIAQMTYKLPTIPEKETRHLGFIADPKQFTEDKMDFSHAACFKIQFQ